jgi:hypothetical protein
MKSNSVIEDMEGTRLGDPKCEIQCDLKDISNGTTLLPIGEEEESNIMNALAQVRLIQDMRRSNSLMREYRKANKESEDATVRFLRMQNQLILSRSSWRREVRERVEKFNLAVGGGQWKSSNASTFNLRERISLAQPWVNQLGSAYKHRLLNIIGPGYCAPGVLDPPSLLSTADLELIKREPRPAHHTLKSQEIALLADGYPSQLEVGLLIDAIDNGVAMGYTGSRTELKWAPRALDMFQARPMKPMTPEEVELCEEQLEGAMTSDPFASQLIATECDKLQREGHLSRYFDQPPFHWGSIGYCFLVPKKEDGAVIEGKFRVISHTECANQGSVDLLTTLPTFQDILEMIGRVECDHPVVTKEDVDAAFRLFRYRPEDVPLTQLYVQNRGFCFSTSMCMGAKSSPAHYIRLASVLTYILRKHALHEAICTYVDDSVCVFKSVDDANRIMNIVAALCARIGVPLSLKKRVPASFNTVILGIEVNTKNRTLGLTDRRRHTLRLMIANLIQSRRTPKGRVSRARTLNNRRIPKRELEVFLGQLQRVVMLEPMVKYYTVRLQIAMTRATRFELESMTNRWDKSKEPKGNSPQWSDVDSRRVFVPMNPLLESDLCRLRCYLSSWRGYVSWPVSQSNKTPLTYLGIASSGSDASATGYGAVWGGMWIGGVWTENELGTAYKRLAVNIAYLELLAAVKLIRSVIRAGLKPESKHFIIGIDNQSVVYAINSGHSTSEEIGTLLSDLAEMCFEHELCVEAVWIETTRNVICDDLSRCFTDHHESNCVCFDSDPNRKEWKSREDLTPCQEIWQGRVRQVLHKHNLDRHQGFVNLNPWEDRPLQVQEQ